MCPVFPTGYQLGPSLVRNVRSILVCYEQPSTGRLAYDTHNAYKKYNRAYHSLVLLCTGKKGYPPVSSNLINQKLYPIIEGFITDKRQPVLAYISPGLVL